MLYEKKTSPHCHRCILRGNPWETLTRNAPSWNLLPLSQPLELRVWHQLWASFSSACTLTSSTSSSFVHSCRRIYCIFSRWGWDEQFCQWHQCRVPQMHVQDHPIVGWVIVPGPMIEGIVKHQCLSDRPCSIFTTNRYSGTGWHLQAEVHV